MDDEANMAAFLNYLHIAELEGVQSVSTVVGLVQVTDGQAVNVGGVTVANLTEREKGKITDPL